MKKLIIASLMVIGLTTQAHAGLLIEPYLGYIFSGETTETGAGASAFNYKYDYSGINYGGRLGYSTFGLQFGLDYNMASYDYETTNATTKLKDAYDFTAFGAFVGFKFPVFLRVWGTYFFNAELKDTDSGTGGVYSPSGAKFEGSGFGLGAGFTGLPFVNINLEYRSFTYDEGTTSDGTKITLPNTTYGVGKHDASEMILSLSVPFDIM